MSIKLYFFECGVLRCDKSLITMGRDAGKIIDIPVPFFLIQHPKANILYDTGNAIEVARDKHKHWGDVVKAYDPIMTEDQYVVNQLKKIGINPEDINYVILSHLHLDHAGGVGDFPNAKYVVQRRELEWAYVPDFYQKLAYIRPDFDKPVNWYLLDGYNDDKFDLLGDGKIQIWFTPGHTPGHQALWVELENSGPFLLTGDSCYTTEILNEDVLPGLVWSPPETVKSVNKLRYARDILGATVVTGHDPEAWKTFKKAPEYYD